MMRFFIAIPTYNGNLIWHDVVREIKRNAPENTAVKIIDSGSKDGTDQIAIEMGFDVKYISSSDFNHGGTRNKFVSDDSECNDIVIFLTQDAIPEDKFIDNILKVFSDPMVACAYGRQLPHVDANPIAQHARYFNYSEISYVCSKADIHELGLKTVFMSNSFSAYRVSIFNSLGGFPSDTILCEDMYFTAKAVLGGYKVAYVSDAIVRHSHNYSPVEEFKRYFDIGVFHTNEPWIREKFGGPRGEGKRFILSELSFLLKNNLTYIPLAFIMNFSKFFGYLVGKKYKKLPYSLIKKISMHKSYWRD